MADHILYTVQRNDEFPVYPEKYVRINQSFYLFKGMIKGIMPVVGGLQETCFFHAVEALDVIHMNGSYAFSDPNHKA